MGGMPGMVSNDVRVELSADKERMNQAGLCAVDTECTLRSRGLPGLNVTSADGHKCTIPTKAIFLSNCLQTLCDKIGPECWIPLPFSWLRAWLAFVTGTASGKSSIHQLLQVVQAADFLADTGTVRKGCRLLGLRLMSCYDESHKSQNSGIRSPCLRDSRYIVSVLESIPSPLALLVLRSIFHLSRAPHLPDATLPGASSRSASVQLAEILPFLPQPLQPLAIRAHDPAVDQHGTLNILDMSPDAAATIAAAAAASGLPLTAVVLQNVACMPVDHVQPQGVVGAQGMLCSALAELTTLPRLASLTLSGVPPAVPCEHMPTLWSKLCSISGLTHLAITKCAHLGSADAGFASCLPWLTSLRSLSLSRCGLTSSRTAACEESNARLTALAAGLRYLSALQLLSFAHNPLTNAGLHILRPALATLPLRSLVLRNCMLELGEGVPLGHDAVGTTMSSCLTRLDISDNALSEAGHALGLRLLQLQRLKHLHLRGLAADTSAQARLLNTLKSRQLRLAKLHLGKISKAQPVLQALCECLAQCPGLADAMLSFTQPVPFTSVLPSMTPDQMPLRHLRHLVLARVSLRDETSLLLPEQAVLPQLVELALTGVGGSQKGVSAFSAWLGGCTALEILSLETSREGAPGGADVAQVVGKLCRLRKLCLIGLEYSRPPRGVLAASLHELSGLQQLHLGGSGMAQQDWADVMAMAGCLPSLEVLRAAEDKVGSGAVQELLRYLPGMTSLRELVLFRCGVTGSERRELVHALLPAAKHNIR